VAVNPQLKPVDLVSWVLCIFKFMTLYCQFMLSCTMMLIVEFCALLEERTVLLCGMLVAVIIGPK